MRAVLLSVVLLLSTAAAAHGSQLELTGQEGHPRSRFPLSVHTPATGQEDLDAAIERAVRDWNALFREVLGVDAFAGVAQADEAQVVVQFESPERPRGMGVAHLQARDGAIVPPVRVVVFAPVPRGRTSRETLLYQVTAHELGHALGLPHVSDPRSIMCCVEGSLDLADPAVRATYVEARRHPDLGSVRDQLAAHYGRFWATAPAAR